MECYDTCADRGRKCVLPRERICCFDCGKIKPCYNIHSAPCSACPPKEPCSCGNKKEAEKWRSGDICKCKQSCWQWILSFLGLGGQLPECCKNIRLTPWQSGEVAREALVSKVQDVVNRVSGKEPSPEKPQAAAEKADTKEADKKVTSSGGSSEKEGHPQETSDESPDQQSVKEPGQAGSEKKKRRASKSRSSSLPRGRTKHRKSGSKSRSTSRSDKQRVKKSSSKTRSRSSSSTSVSQGSRKRKGRRSRSGSSTKIFNPFKGRTQTSQCNMRSPYCPPLPCMPCPGTQPKTLLSCLNEDHIATFPEKGSSAGHKQPTHCPPTQIHRSNSMSNKQFDSCVKHDPVGCPCRSEGSPGVLLRSHSFDSTPMKCSSHHSSCMSGHTTCPRSGTWTCCSCSLKSNTPMKPYTRGFDSSRLSSCGCQSVVRPLPGMCPPSCTKPCCLPLPGKLGSQYTPPSPSRAKVSCCAALNILKARQNDALCNQLLSKYGYSPPSSRLCPMTCYGCPAANTCCTTSCLKYGRFPGMGGCMACRPMAEHINCGLCCAHCENFTNSRTPRSPECHPVSNQMIEFNQSPCEKKSLCEFQLPPHCIRETGPRSPVDEYMAIIRVPKPVKKQDLQEGAEAEKPNEAEDATKKEQTEEANGPKKKGKRLSKKGSRASQSRNVNENARSGCHSHIKSSRSQLYMAKPGWPSDPPELTSQISSSRLQLYMAKPGSPNGVIVPNDVSDCWRSDCKESFNNNYGGESYRISRYSSAGPVQIDFSELHARTNRYSSIPTHSSASSGFVARYPRPNYHSPASGSEVRAITSFVSQRYSRDTRDFLDSRHFGESWYRPRTAGSLNINTHKLRDNRPMPFNRSTNSTVLDSSEVANSSKYNVNLETAIENKIRELRDSRVFGSPPARRKMYSNTLFEQMAKAHEKPSVPGRRNVIQEEFIRENLDQLKYRADKRKQELRYSDAYAHLVVPNVTMSDEPAARDKTTNQAPTDSFNKLCAVSLKQNTTTCLRENAPNLEDSKTRDYLQKSSPSPRIKKQMGGDITKDKPTVQKPVCSESTKAGDVKPKSMLDYEPVFQSIFEHFEETVQVFVRSKKEPVPISESALKPTEPQQSMLKVFTEDNQDKGRDVNAKLVERNEENHSSNKADKSLGNVRTILAESSPPHKPIMVKSSEAENSSVCTCSCRSNSSGTSSVSLEVSRFARSAHSSHSVSESASCVDTSTTFTKITDNLRPPAETSVDYSSNPVIQSVSVTTVVANKCNQSDQTEDLTTNSNIPNSQVQIPAENEKTLTTEKPVRASWGDSGSSVDPVVKQYATKFSNVIGNSSVDDSAEFYLIQDIPTAHAHVMDKAEAGDATQCPSSTDVDMLPSQKPPDSVKSLTELMREFIRRNGTPV